MQRGTSAFSFQELLNKEQLNTRKEHKNDVFEHENPNTSSFHILKHFLRKYNHNHDPKTGRFTSGNGSSSNPMVRTKPAPKNTKTAYKVFVVKDGKLYPPMVANPNASDTPVGVWLDASEGTKAPDSKTGRPQVKAGGKGTQGGSGSLAYRPGWHLGEYPEAKQFARKNPETGKKELFPENFVWAECEIAADVNYQEEAMSYGYNKNGKFQHSLAGLPKLPTDGYYTYRTNPDPTTQPWYITGSMKVTRLLTDAETDAILRDRGITPMKRKGGELDPKALGLDESLFTVKKSKVEKYNHNHDPKTGRFTSGSGSSGSWSNTLASEKERVLGLKSNRQAEYLYDSSADTYDNCVEAMRNGTTESLLNEYFNIMESNGDPTPTKPLANNHSHNRNLDVYDGKYSSHEEAKTAYVAEDTGMNLSDAKIAVKEVEKWTSGSMNGDRQILDNFVEKSPAYDGQIYRGLKFSDEDYSSFMSNIEKGSVISMNGTNSSWSSDREVAHMYAQHVYDDANSVVITCAKNRTSAPVEHLTINSGEREVLASSKASWTVLHYEVRETSAGKHKAYITVVERGEGR